MQEVLLLFFDDDGGGLVCAKTDQDQSSWQPASGDFASIEATGTAVGTGQTNTTKTTDRYGAENYAAKICDNYSVDGYNDWFLPSKDELDLMYENLHTASIGNFQNDFYWSSTEDDKDDAWLQDFGSNRDQYYDTKSAVHNVRAVRAFEKE